MQIKNFQNIQDDQRDGIINILTKMEIYMPQKFILDDTEIKVTHGYFPTEKIFSLEVQYWVIKELYFSPYRIYLNDLDRKIFMLKLLKTEKYCGDPAENPILFINYYIKCIMEHFDNIKTKKNIGTKILINSEEGVQNA